MALTVKQILSARTDEALFKLLSEELARLFPPSVLGNTDLFLAALQIVPRGMRAMAAIYQLDVSMALDDLAWHFVNHHDRRLYEETRLGLRELEAHAAAVLFEKAYEIVASHWDELGLVMQEILGGDIHDWLDSTGIQKQIDPLNAKMWALIKRNETYGLMHYWLSYARTHAERCVGGKPVANGQDRPPTEIETPNEN